jgi:hypothetical protein
MLGARWGSPVLAAAVFRSQLGHYAGSWLFAPSWSGAGRSLPALPAPINLAFRGEKETEKSHPALGEAERNG